MIAIDHPRVRRAASVLLTLGLLVSACGTDDGEPSAGSQANELEVGSSNQSDEAEVPVRELAAYVEPISPVEALRAGDTVVRAQLRSVSTGGRFVYGSGEEDGDIATEKYDLGFEVLETFVGDARPGESISVVGPGGWVVDAETLVRQIRLEQDGVGLEDWAPDTEYVFFYTQLDESTLFRSFQLIAVLDAQGRVTPLVSDDNAQSEFAGVSDLEGLRVVLNEMRGEAGREG